MSYQNFIIGLRLPGDDFVEGGIDETESSLITDLISLKTKVDFYPYTSHSKMWGQSIHAWGESGNSFDMAIQVASTSVLAESPYYSTSNTNTYIDTFLLTSNDTIWYNISADSAHPLNGRPQI